MNYLLYGSDTYRSRKKLREIIAEYQRKAGSLLNLSRFDAAEDDLVGLRAAAAGGSLFDAKKLIVVERPLVSRDSCERVAGLMADTASRSDAIAAVWEGAVDGEAKKLVAQLTPLAQKKQEFTMLSGAALARWIRDEARERGMTLGQEEVAELARSGTDSWGIVSGMEKIAVCAPARDARGGSPPRAPTIFDLGDAFFSAPREARRILLSLIRAGEDEMRLFAYLTGHARTLLMIKAYAERGDSAPSSAKVHPYVLKKTSRQIGMLSVAGLWRTLERFLEEDVRIKTGASTARESLQRLLE